MAIGLTGRKFDGAAQALKVLDRTGSVREAYLNAKGVKLRSLGKPRFKASSESDRLAGLVKSKKPAAASDPRPREDVYSINGHQVSREDWSEFVALARDIETANGQARELDIGKSLGTELGITWLLDRDGNGAISVGDFINKPGRPNWHPEFFKKTFNILKKHGYDLSQKIGNVEVLLHDDKFMVHNYELAFFSLYRSTKYIHDIPAGLLRLRPELITQALILDSGFLEGEGKHQAMIQGLLPQALEEVQKESTEGRRLFPFSLETARRLEARGIDIPCDEALQALQAEGLRFSTPVASYGEMMQALADDYNVHFPKRFNQVKNLVKALKNREHDPLDNRPVTTVLYPKHDPNEAYAYGNSLDTFVGNDRTKAPYYESGNNVEGGKTLVASSHGGIRKTNVVVGGHGYVAKGLRLGIEDKPDSYLKREDFISGEGIGGVLPKIVDQWSYLDSCNSGAGEASGDNLQNAMASTMPAETTSYGYTDEGTMPEKIEIGEGGQLKIKVNRGKVYVAPGRN